MTELADRPATAPSGSTAPLFLGRSLVSGPITETWHTTVTDTRWAHRVVDSLRPAERAVCVLSFAPDGPAICHRVAPGEAPEGSPGGPVGPRPPDAPARQHSVVANPTPEQYAANVATALAHIADGHVEKVVLGRGLDIISTPPIEAEEVLARLLATRPGRYVAATHGELVRQPAAAAVAAVLSEGVDGAPGSVAAGSGAP